MRFIRDLNPETQKLLERISCQSNSPQVRDRAKCILLSYQKFSINQLEVKIPRLEELKKQAKKGEIDLKYLDESGFSLKPDVPYGWQEKGERITLKSSQSNRISVLGLMDYNNELDYEIHQEIINSDVVIKFLDKISKNLKKATVIVLDQASIHTSDKFINKLEEWREKN